jgi:hypothetical protein
MTWRIILYNEQAELSSIWNKRGLAHKKVVENSGGMMYNKL